MADKAKAGSAKGKDEAAKAQAESKRKAYLEKRLQATLALRAKDEQAFLRKINYKEAKDLAVSTSWKEFCEMKANVYSTFWMGLSTKGPKLNEKVKERKLARLEKLKKLMAKLAEETGATA